MTREEAEKIAIEAMPGWRVVRSPRSLGRVKPLTFLNPAKSLDELKAKYFRAGSPTSVAAEEKAKDLHFVSMTPKESGGRDMVKMVLVRDGKVVAAQG